MIAKLPLILIALFSFLMPSDCVRADELLIGQVLELDRKASNLKVLPVSEEETRTETADKVAVSIHLVDGYLPANISKGSLVRIWLTPPSSAEEVKPSGASLNGRLGRGRCGRCDCTGIRLRLKRSMTGGMHGRGMGFHGDWGK